MRQISPDLQDKLTSDIQTQSNNSDPRMSIQVTRAKSAVIDSTYWTVETIRSKTGLGEISIDTRRLQPHGRPDRVYEIHVDNGIVKTALREYPDHKKEGWKPQIELGSGKAVAISFDGNWEIYRRKWRIKTDESPWLFWVDATGTLWTQLWDDETTRVNLSSSVSVVKSIRGWKNVNITEKDQGIIAAYIKTDGKIYYRNYCMQSDGTTIWESERAFDTFTGTAVQLNLFLTNDYRLGLVTESDDGTISTYVTPRNWAGMAIAPGKFAVRSKVDLDLIEIGKIKMKVAEKISVISQVTLTPLYAAASNAFTEIQNVLYGTDNFGLAISFKLSYELFDIDPRDFKLVDSQNNQFSIESVVKVDAENYTAYTSDFNNARGDLTLSFLGEQGTNPAGFKYSAFTGTFTPQNLVPLNIPVPEVASIRAEGEEGQFIIIGFTEQLTGNNDIDASAFKVTGQEYQYVGGPILNMDYEVVKAYDYEGSVIQFLITVYPFGGRFNNVIGDLTVTYDDQIGTLAGLGGKVLSFTKTFTPTGLLAKPNPKIDEFLLGSIQSTLTFTKVTYTKHRPEEHLEITASCALTLTETGVVNP